VARTRRKFDEDFKAGAVRIVRETGKPIALVARELGINEGTLGNWCARERARGAGDGALTENERAELERLRRENAEVDFADLWVRLAGEMTKCFLFTRGSRIRARRCTGCSPPRARRRSWKATWPRSRPWAASRPATAPGRRPPSRSGSCETCPNAPAPPAIPSAGPSVTHVSTRQNY